MIKQSIVLLFSLTCLFGCPTYDPAQGRLVIENSSDSTIYVYCTCADSIEQKNGLKVYAVDFSNRTNKLGERMLPDTVNLDYKIERHAVDSLLGFGTRKQRKINCRDKTIRLFIISESTMLANTWPEISHEQIYQQKMMFTQHQLESLGWKILYH